MIKVFEKKFFLQEIPTHGTLKFYSDMQQATIELYRDQTTVFERHCGNGNNDIYTEWQEWTQEDNSLFANYVPLDEWIEWKYGKE